jgi:hypothetical protein
MPIEIKELHIKATIVDKKLGADTINGFSSLEKERLKKEIIKTCIEEVLQILEDKKER